MERALRWPGGCRTHVSIALKYWPGDASRARCPKTTSSTSSCDTDREGSAMSVGDFRAEIVARRRGKRAAGEGATEKKEGETRNGRFVA